MNCERHDWCNDERSGSEEEYVEGAMLRMSREKTLFK